ncbi:hypothetical protein [Enterococcus sp. RIT-PI-f]|uniref:hypothetical protein n=1 Tax=Enterococcus sp. RIT-PI-f TaxID=1690244 RepID=UPI0006B892A8|nr:hypothetical protein [Enterococcus sp. RIT-PI-f]KPG70870.1 hypothetical protein AEQ18_06740 [Enterococcus sp. RIT-PI-f]
MNNMLTNSLKELKFISCAVFIFYLLFEIVNMVIIGSNSAISQGLELWVYATDIVDFFAPLFLTAPFVWILFFKNKSRFIEYVSVRINLKKYLISQILSVTLSVAMITFSVNIIAMLLAIYVIPFHLDTDPSIFKIPILPFMFQTNEPLIFVIFASFWKGILGGLFAFSASVLACTTNNLFISLFGILGYVLLENIITASLGFDEYSIVTSNVLGRLSDEYYNSFNMFIGPLLMMFFTFLWVVFYRKHMRN